MRKLYAFLLCMATLWGLASSAQATTYAITDYIARSNTDPWTPISGTAIPELNSQPYYYTLSNPITVQFPIHFLNTTLTNPIRVGGDGQVICSPTFNNNYDWGAEEYYYNSPFGTYDYRDIYNTEGAISGYFPNYSLHPWTGLSYNYGSKYSYTTLGTAPNRQFVVEALNQQNYPGTVKGSWQTVIFEAGISTFQFNYGPQTGTTYHWSEYNASQYLRATGITVDGMTGTQGALSLGANGGGQPSISYNTILDNSQKDLPTVNYRVLLAYNYDFSADQINVPADGAILKVNVPVTPNGTITNQGSKTITQVIVEDKIALPGTGTVYDKFDTLTGGQIPANFSSTNVSFPNFTPTAFGIYYDTLTIVSTTPTDQFPGNNVATSSFQVSPANDIRPLAILSPSPGSRTPVNIATPVTVRFQNAGTSDQINVPVSAVIKDPSGTVVYRDTAFFASFPTNTIRDTSFKDWTPATNGDYQVCAISLLPGDQLKQNDTLCRTVSVRFLQDVAAVGVQDPQPDEEKPYTKVFHPTGIFQSVGVQDLFDVPARVQIHRCSDGVVVFQADSTIPELNNDQGPVQFGFPAKQGAYDITTLPPGCYTQCVIANLPTDGDRTNDTACTTFSIIDRLKGNIEVGVGKRFQTLTAAVDSMRFRGIGGNLNLILTDANYTENGNTNASSQQGALDFSGITGVLNDTSHVTIRPKAGVSPTITFNGSKPFGFYFGYKSANYFIFDGQNSIGIPPPDGVLPEPAKRGMTVVDNSTAAGAPFSFQFGAHHDVVRNVKIYGNGQFNPDNSAGVLLLNDVSQALFVSGMRDTLPVHDVRIENNEIGNAKYGIADHGVHPLFSIGPSKFFDRRNYNNTFTRNTIGTTIDPIGYAGIGFDNAENYTISHNNISNVNGALSSSGNALGIGLLFEGGSYGGNAVGIKIDANRIHDISAPGAAVGDIFFQSGQIYVNGTGPSQARSTLPTNTHNLTTNNFVYDLRGSTNLPVYYATMASNYFTDRDSIFNNSISADNGAVNIYMYNVSHTFTWNNIIQDTGTVNMTANYYFQVPRPMLSALSSDYNDFDIKGMPFAIVSEVDPSTGNQIQNRTFRTLNDWRSFTQQDIHSVVGDPRFGVNPDSLHLPDASTYIVSPASRAGIWLNSASQKYDFDGQQRLVGNGTPNIGADENEGYQYTNDLAVQAITRPPGYSNTSDTTFATIENPMAIQALVRNLSAQAVFNKTVTATLEVAMSGGPYMTIYTGTSAPLTFDVNETKVVDFVGPNITPAQEQNGVFRLTVSVPNDQNNSNNSQTKIFRVLVKRNALLVSYETSTVAGQMNRDSVFKALQRIGILYDTLNRTNYGVTDLDYTPWWTIIWSTGDPTMAFTGAGAGSGALSFKETEELGRFLAAGQTYAKKSLIMAGENIMFYNDFGNINGNMRTDTEFTRGALHTQYRNLSPTGGTYDGYIRGDQPVYFTFQDSLHTLSTPNLVAPSSTTPPVGPYVAGFAYHYLNHPADAIDSGAGTTWATPKTNTVFYAFDWEDPQQTNPGEAGILTSGTTRVIRGALDFIQGHAGTILPLEFTAVRANHSNDNRSNVITWETAHQKDVARFEVEMQNGKNWSLIGSVDANKFAFQHSGIDMTKDYTYRVVGVDVDGTRKASTTASVSGIMPGEFALDQNFPNPFNPSTTISYTLPVSSVVTLKVLDVTGKVVRTVIDRENIAAGNHTVPFVADQLASGTYVYELSAVQANGQSLLLTRKMTLNK